MHSQYWRTSTSSSSLCCYEHAKNKSKESGEWTYKPHLALLNNASAERAAIGHSFPLTSKHFISPCNLRNHEETTNGAVDTCLLPYPILCQINRTQKDRLRDKVLGHQALSIAWHVALCQSDVTIFSTRYKIRCASQTNHYQVMRRALRQRQKLSRERKGKVELHALTATALYNVLRYLLWR